MEGDGEGVRRRYQMIVVAIRLCQLAELFGKLQFLVFGHAAALACFHDLSSRVKIGKNDGLKVKFGLSQQRPTPSLHRLMDGYTFSCCSSGDECINIISFGFPAFAFVRF